MTTRVVRRSRGGDIGDDGQRQIISGMLGLSRFHRTILLRVATERAELRGRIKPNISEVLREAMDEWIAKHGLAGKVR